MDKSRRGFLGIAGGVLLGGVPLAARAISSANQLGTVEKPNPSARTANQWAMIVDTKKCQEKGDCRACSEACHLIHNVPKIEDPEEEIKWIWKEPYAHVFPDQGHKYDSEEFRNRPVIVLCNHCERPACVRVCPTKATWRRETDGIVMMDMHRCIGCRYCIVACPFGSRSFNWKDPRPFIEHEQMDFPTRTRGVVEKCNFCAERLAVGKIPACVEACQKQNCGALIFGDVSDPNTEVSRVLKETHTIRRKPGLGTEPQVYYIV